jgi:Protein of unknown function (DUF3750)
MSVLRITLLVLACLPVYVIAAVAYLRVTTPTRPLDWRSASQESVGLAPDPQSMRGAIVQVYVARAWGWRGYFGVHPWIAVKPAGARRYTVYEVHGWRTRWGSSTVVASERTPDGAWYGSTPELIGEARGAAAEKLFGRIDAAARNYPWAHRYNLWPGPNSNTFVAHVLRAVPELRVDLPPHAVGKDYLGLRPFARTTSGTGVQVSVLGLLGVTAGWREGFEVNVLGLVFGIDPRRLALKLALIGRVGPRRLQPSAEKRAVSTPPVNPLTPDE